MSDDDEIGTTCSTNDRVEKCYKILVEKLAERKDLADLTNEGII
jgi:hypothetical protein